jgi:hypothetical protein
MMQSAFAADVAACMDRFAGSSVGALASCRHAVLAAPALRMAGVVPAASSAESRAARSQQHEWGCRRHEASHQVTKTVQFARAVSTDVSLRGAGSVGHVRMIN